MNLAEYRLKRANLLLQEMSYRVLCTTCAQPQFSCYCAHVTVFDPKIHFVILIHPIEVKRRIATGRMSHLSLQSSTLIKGQNYTNNTVVNELVDDSSHHSVILYPGLESKNISLLDEKEKISLFPQNKKLRIFVIDGTWATARRMVRQSENIKNLPRICFSPQKPSNFRVRKQPHANCYSTIEAIHHTIELLGESQGFDIKERTHDKLITTFDFMVEKQLQFIRESQLKIRGASYRQDGQKKIS